MNQNTMITSVAALFGVTLVAVTAVAQGVAVDAPGTTVRVGPDRGAGQGGADVDVQVDVPGVTIRVPAGNTPPAIDAPVIDVPPVEKQYRIGLVGGDVSPELRLHLGLEGVGVIVREVVPGGAAATAGVEKHDILLSADGAPLAKIQDLVSVVRAAGPEQRPIALELIRRGKTITLGVTPVEQAAQPRPAPQGFDGPFGGREGGFGFGDQQPFQFRMLGPGVAVGGLGNAQIMANGISVQVQSQNGQSRVTAKKGEQTWEFDANDQEAINQLPPDVRQMVQGVTAGGGGVGVNIDANGMIQELAPALQGWFDRRGDRRNLRERMEAMEQELLEMQQRMLGAAGAAVEEGAIGGGEAPVFEPGDALESAPPVEIEIPAEAE